SVHKQSIPLWIFELQAEDWGKFTAPGDNPEEVKYNLLRGASIKPEKMLIWGIEKAVRRLFLEPWEFTEDHRRIMQIYARMNGISKDEINQSINEVLEKRKQEMDKAAKEQIDEDRYERIDQVAIRKRPWKPVLELGVFA